MQGSSHTAMGIAALFVKGDMICECRTPEGRCVLQLAGEWWREGGLVSLE